VYDRSKLLPKSQFQQLMNLLPTPRWKRNGRNPSKKEAITVGSIDTTLVQSFAFRQLSGWNGQHKQRGTKISLFVGKDGLPADVQFGKGSINDKVFLLGHLKNVAGKRKKILNLDMSYMSLALRRTLRQTCLPAGRKESE
jgi:hypothetical protein